VNEQNLEKDDDEESIDAILDHDPLDAPYGDEDIDSEEENDDNYDKDDKDDKNDVTIFVTEADEENPKQIIKI
jgi:hypothetical protein